jgi:L-fuculose-phosphate aldolase
MPYEGQAAAIVAACRRLHTRGLLAGTEGNVSVRVNEGWMLITPSGADKATLDPEHVVLAPLLSGPHHHTSTSDRADRDAPTRDSNTRASSEIEMHRACYATRPDVRAVVHAHPPVATGLATAGKTLPANVIPELPVVVGPVALVPYARPGTPALGEAMALLLPGHEVFLLANHGVTAVGQSLEEALQRMESTEQAARIFFVAQLMGGAALLSAAEVDDLLALHPRAPAHLKYNTP